MWNEELIEHTKKEAQGQLSSVVRAVEALKADPDRRAEILKEDWGVEDPPEDITRDDAMEALAWLPLAVTCRSSWENRPTNLSPDEYKIDLGTGGPAVRIVGDFNLYGDVANVRMEYSDQGIPWTRLGVPIEAKNAMREFAQIVTEDVGISP